MARKSAGVGLRILRSSCSCRAIQEVLLEVVLLGDLVGVEGAREALVHLRGQALCLLLVTLGPILGRLGGEALEVVQLAVLLGGELGLLGELLDAVLDAPGRVGDRAAAHLALRELEIGPLPLLGVRTAWTSCGGA